jgi:nucleoside-diphosphate-sugar epimerase
MALNGLRVLVTGSSGLVGSRLVAQLRGQGVTVIEADARTGMDITDWSTMQSLPALDAIVHLAAMTYVPDSYDRPRQFYVTNVLGTLSALELCRLRKARMIFASSYVYGRPRYLPIDEGHPVESFNPYAETKIQGERLCYAYHRDFRVRATVLRPFNIYGPGQDQRFLLPSIIRQARTGAILLKDPRPRRDFVFVDDVVEAYLAAIGYEGKEYDTFNVGAGVSFSVAEVVDHVCRQMALKPTVAYTGERRESEVEETRADTTRASQCLGWRPRVEFADGIRLCVSADQA